MENLKNKKLWLTSGVPGLGKSTWIQKHIQFFDGKVVTISRDEIRFSLLKEGEDYFAHEKEVWNKYTTDAINALNECDNIILDATHLNERSRAKILRALRTSLKNVEINILFFKGSEQLAIQRNEGRAGLQYVPPAQIKRMIIQTTTPTFEEGFDNIYIIDAETGKIKLMKKVV